MKILDSFRNAVSGMMGSARDKTVNVEAVFAPLSLKEIDALFRGNALARKIVEIVPDDMTRQWRSWSLKGDAVGKIERAERRLRLRFVIEHALTTARLYGGAIIYIGMADNTPMLPLPSTIAKGSLRFLTVLPRHLVSWGEVEDDPMNTRFRLPRSYTISSALQTVEIHPSRIIHVRGLPGQIDDPFGDSVFDALRDSLIQDGIAAQSAAHLIGEAKIDVITMEDLSELASTEAGQRRITERFALGATVRGIYSTLLLGSGETFSQKQIQFGSLPQLLDAFAQRLCAAADIPAPRLLGRHPGGLNSTGDADIRNYYDRIKSDQERDLRPALDQLDAIIWPSEVGANKPDDAWFEFNPLWQTSEKERAEIAFSKAKTVLAYRDSGAVPDDVLVAGVKAMLSEDTIFPGIERAWAEFESGILPAAQIEGRESVEPDNDDEPGIVPRRRAANDARPRTLYVSRPVVNSAEIIAWAKAQGFTTTLAAADLHVTIAYSREPVDWMAAGTDSARIEIEEGGPRLIERFDGGAVVLLFSSWQLAWRHGDFRRQGATWDHPEYQPHITITYDAGAVDLDAVEPYRGKIVLGAERFAEVDEGWKSTVKES